MSVAPAIEQHYPGLSGAQRSIVADLPGPLLVIAGPGSGKTLSIVRDRMQFSREAAGCAASRPGPSGGRAAS